MAPLKEIIDNVARKNDVPYSWPDQTCVQIVLDFATIALDRFIVPLPILDMGELRAAAYIKKYYGSSWFRAFREKVSRRPYACGWEIPTSGLWTGDIVEFKNPGFIFRGFDTGIGLIYDEDWIYSKGEDFVLPVPIGSSEILSAVRLDICRL